MKRISVGHALFAGALIWLGLQGLLKSDFAQIWAPAPKYVPHVAFAFLTSLISLACGVGLLFTRSAAVASRVIFAAFMVWLLVTRVPPLFYQKPLVLVAWTAGCTGVMLAAAWLLYVRLAGEIDKSPLYFLGGEAGTRVARPIYGLSLIPFGLAHFMYVDATTVLIPNWIPWHTAMAYFTGAAFIGAGLAIVVGVMPRLAAALSTAQIGLFSLIVWVPRVLTGNLTPFQWGEWVTTCVLTAAAWVVAESYNSEPWLARGPR